MIYLLVFLSGLAGLVYEVLWMKQLGLLFGSTSQAAAVTFAAFFAGLAAGSWFWGRRSTLMKNPLRGYAMLEVGIAVTAIIYFGILDLYYYIYPWLYQNVNSASMLLAAKFVLSFILVFPPAFFMGGTIPVMGQHVIKNLSGFGVKSALLYGINTLGAVAGVALAGFILPLLLGFNGTFIGAMAVTSSIAITAFLMSRASGMEIKPAGAVKTAVPHAESRGRLPILLVCFLSGFGILALEVLWTRMFAQVLENSVYTFSAILVVVLLCLAGGALISSLIARMKVSPIHVLASLMLTGGLTVCMTPYIFMVITDSMHIIVSTGTWLEYLGLIFKSVVITIALPALILGAVFPFLMKAEESHADSAGKSLGMLASVNTAGAILGSLVCGFLLLEQLGMWGTMRLLSVIYLVAALALPVGWGRNGMIMKGFCAAMILMQFWVLDPTGLPVNSIDKLRPNQEILETWEASDCTVAVARDSTGLLIKINSHYGLGSTGAAIQQKLQSHVPLMAYPDTRSMFFLGLGTGITAGSALDPQFTSVKSVVACELVPEVITAAKKYIANVDGADFTCGLFTDPRAKVIAEDGRHYLMATREKYDIINSDLFIPFRTGAGSLYSKEHFLSVKERLEPGGVFFQWLPLYQVTEYELHVIIRTMLESFDHVTLWRSNFQPGDEVIAIAGHKAGAALAPCGIDSSDDKRLAVSGKSHRDLSSLALPFNQQTILFFYCGNLTASKDLFADYPVNTDDMPIIEYEAPRTYRNLKATTIPWFVGPRMAMLVDEIQKRCPPDKDPLLANRSPEDKRLPVAGAAYHWARIWEVIGDEKQCKDAWQRFLGEWTESAEK